MLTPDTDAEDSYQVDPSLHEKRGVRKLRYFQDDESEGIRREVFIKFKGNKRTGDLLYGATICRRPIDSEPMNDEMVKSHFKTARSRLDKCPVHMNITDEFRHQLEKNAQHREDVMYEIVDTIFTRRSGMIQIRGHRDRTPAVCA